jgi:uncharacterized protein (DUF302 family)
MKQVMHDPISMKESQTVDGLRVFATRQTLEGVLERIATLARKRGLQVFARIDFAADARKAGLELPPTVLLIVGNPAAGTPLLAAARTLAIDLPLKILAWTDEDGHNWVACNEPEYLQRRHGVPAELVGNISGLAALLAAAVAQGD